MFYYRTVDFLAREWLKLMDGFSVTIYFFVNGVLESQFLKDLFDHIMYKITGIW